MGKVIQALRASADPEAFFRKQQDREGDPFLVHLPRLDPIVMTGRPAYARELFSAPPATFVPVAGNPVEPLLGPGSMILLQPEPHARERRRLSPPFRGERMRAYGEIIRRAAREALAAWPTGGELPAQSLTQSITLQVIIQAVFGVTDDDRRAEFARSILAMTERYTPPLMLVPALRRPFGGIGPWAGFSRAKAAFDHLLAEEIDARRAEGAHDREDILSLLLETRDEDGEGLSPDELLDELRTLLVAGHETSSLVLAWALHFVLTTEGVQSRLRDELGALGAEPSPEVVAKAPYLGAVINEALRLHPVVPILLRCLTTEYELFGALRPAGTNVGIAVTLLHHDPEVWTDPATFEPQRFLDRKYAPWEHAPYGGGHRRCLGAALATYEMKIILATIIMETELTPLDTRPQRPVLRNITMGPKHPIRLRRQS